jgi:hypothetical protein
MAEGGLIRPDIRTDIFSLGVILYELITGVQPLSNDTLKGLAIHELTENVARIERPAPSTAYSRLDAETSEKIRLARNIPTEKELTRYLNGRLRHLPMTALRLDRNKRYTTVATFANDIENYLHDRDYAQAAQEPWRDRVLRNLRRHKVPYAAAAIVLCALTLGIIGTTLGMKWARDEATRASTAEQKAVLALENEAFQRTRADEEAKRVKAEMQRARRSEYVNRIASAASNIEHANIMQARILLDNCPVDLRHYEWHRLRAVMDVSSSTMRGHEGNVESVAFSPDGKRIVSGSLDKTIKVWDTKHADAYGDEVITGPVAITVATDDGDADENGEGNGDEGTGVIPEESQGE